MDDARKTDVAVVGGGLMGAAAAWQLAGRGYGVTLFEQYQFTHVRGSSHGPSRIFRLTYDIEDYVRLGQLALPLWRTAEAELGAELLWNCGGLDLGLAENLEPIAGALSVAGAKFDRLTLGQVEERFPAYKTSPDWGALYHPDGGLVYADRARLGLLELAREKGTAVLAEARVDRLIPGDNDVYLETRAGAWKADQVVVAAAGWSNRLLERFGLAIPLTVTREHVAYYKYRGPDPILPTVWYLGDEILFYALPNGHREEAKVGQHKSGPEVDPDSEPLLEEGRLSPVDSFVEAFLPGLGRPPVAKETCLYASTPDDDFVIDRVGRIIIGIGFGGHGFKFGVVIGKILADLTEGKEIPFRHRFSLARFKSTAVPGL